MKYVFFVCFLGLLKISFAQSTPVDEHKVKLYRQTGISNFFEFNYEGAIQKLSYVIRSHPEDHEALYYRALCKVEIGDAKSAINDLNKCAILQEENAEYAFKIADLQLLLGKYELALKSYNVALQVCEENPTDVNKKVLPNIYYQRAYANMKLTNTIGACEDLKMATKLHFPEADKIMKKFCK